ncbi:glycoside hydrolase family 16 protein [Hebeloma cylindrosporum]|uniref:Glycoside hydrolase family 16 protein n=1 Tax=Hebeloma cylindrosporum TaxID=76867 RepID=A0A0C2Z741_HEBCY|nr:glycoside hydrolase family 16 protein [Hebeloma cylindrosporum h7]
MRIPLAHLHKRPIMCMLQQAFDVAAYMKACSAVSNSTSRQIINPIQSAWLTTCKTASIKYGRIEVKAKIPTGDWLWPAIWMLSIDNTYGLWPISGEIDIMEARRNGPSYPKQHGTDYVRVPKLRLSIVTFVD